MFFGVIGGEEVVVGCVVEYCVVDDCIVVGNKGSIYWRLYYNGVVG